MSPDVAASMPAFSIVHPSTRTLLIISAIPARCPLPEWMKTGKFAGSLAAFRNGSMGAGSSVIGLIAKTRYFIPAASVAARSAPLSAPPARSITVLMPRFFKAGIARSREVIEPPVDTVLSTNQKLLMPGTVKRLLFCADDSAGKPASMTRRPLQRSRFRFMRIILRYAEVMTNADSEQFWKLRTVPEFAIAQQVLNSISARIIATLFAT